MYKNLAAALAAACFFAPVFSQTKAPATAATAAVVKAGFVYVSPITEAGWTRQHDEGLRHIVEDVVQGDRLCHQHLFDATHIPANNFSTSLLQLEDDVKFIGIARYPGIRLDRKGTHA